jgi:hypothetical protein
MWCKTRWMRALHVLHPTWEARFIAWVTFGNSKTKNWTHDPALRHLSSIIDPTTQRYAGHLSPLSKNSNESNPRPSTTPSLSADQLKRILTSQQLSSTPYTHNDQYLTAEKNRTNDPALPPSKYHITPLHWQTKNWNPRPTTLHQPYARPGTTRPSCTHWP